MPDCHDVAENLLRAIVSFVSLFVCWAAWALEGAKPSLHVVIQDEETNIHAKCVESRKQATVSRTKQIYANVEKRQTS